MTPSERVINDAFERHLWPCFDTAAQQIVTREHGAEAATRVRAAYNELINVPVDWRTATMDTALAVLHDTLDTRYAWLSRKARASVCGAFVMTWK